MSRATLFEERNLQGRSMELMSDCPDVSNIIGSCQSIRVERGSIIIYDRQNFRGNQILLRRGEYPDIQRMMRSMDMMGIGMGMDIGMGMGMGMGMESMMMMDSIRSCRVIKPHRGICRMRVFERESFNGQMMEVMDDIENILERLRMSDIQSVQVMEGQFMLFEMPDFRGRMVYVMPGEHRSLKEISNITRISSIKRIMESM